MRVFVDEKEEIFETNKFSTAREIFSFLQKELAKKGRLISKIVVNSEEKSFSQLQNLGLKDIKTLEFYTQEKEIVLKKALREILVNLPNLVKNLSNIVSSLRKGEEIKALENYANQVPLLSSIILGLQVAEQELKENFSFDYSNLINCLQNINNAYINQDYILLADTLEYELIPWLVRIAESIAVKVKS